MGIRSVRSLAMMVGLGLLLTPIPCHAGEVIVSCVKMGGDVTFEVGVAGEDLVTTITYPKPISSYLGGFEDGAKNYSAGVAVYFDTDADPETGPEVDEFLKPSLSGFEFALRANEMSTSIGRDAEGNWINGPMLFLSVTSDGEDIELPEDVFLEWEMKAGEVFAPVDWTQVPESRTMRAAIPLSVLGLESGATIRFAGVVPLCNDAFPFASAEVGTSK